MTSRNAPIPPVAAVTRATRRRSMPARVLSCLFAAALLAGGARGPLLAGGAIGLGYLTNYQALALLPAALAWVLLRRLADGAPEAAGDGEQESFRQRVPHEAAAARAAKIAALLPGIDPARLR